MAKTKKKEKIIEEIVESLDTKVLSNSDLLQLETGLRDVEAAKLRVAIESQFLNNLLLEQKLLEVKIEKQKQFVQAKSKEYENEKQKVQGLKEDIFKRYGVEGEKFGYDPLSGAIII